MLLRAKSVNQPKYMNKNHETGLDSSVTGSTSGWHLSATPLFELSKLLAQ